MTHSFISRQAPIGVDFDGSSYLSRASALTGDVDSKTGTIAFWAKIGVSDGTETTIFHGKHTSQSGSFRVFRSTTNRISILSTRPNSGTTTLYISTEASITASLNWFHFMASWDLSDTGKRHIYVNGTAHTIAVTTYDNNAADLTHNTWTLGRNQLTASNYDGSLGDFMFWPNTYVDLSNATNRASLYLSGPVPASRAVSVIGTPTVQFSGSWSSWKTNKGSGGAFTETGTLTQDTFSL